MKFELMISVVINIFVTILLWSPFGKLWSELFSVFFRIGDITNAPFIYYVIMVLLSYTITYIPILLIILGIINFLRR